MLTIKSTEASFDLIIQNMDKNQQLVSSAVEESQFIPTLKEKFLEIIRSSTMGLDSKVSTLQAYYKGYKKLVLQINLQSIKTLSQTTTLVGKILSYLPFNEQRKVQRTSKTFYTAIESGESLKQLFSSIKDLDFKTLKKYSETHGLSFSEIIHYCTGLESLNLSFCDIYDAQLSAIMKKISPTLQTLYLSGCSGLRNPPDLSACTQLQNLNLFYCTGLQNPPDLSACTQLQNLNLFGCTGLKNPPNLSACTQLQILNLSRCTGVQNPPNLSACTKLQKLNLSGCTGLKNPPDLSACTKLQVLYLTDCTGLKNPPDLSACTTLHIRSLPDHLKPT